MARLNYTLLDRYLLTLTSRVDGSSRLAEGNKFASFPSVALGWRVLDDATNQRFGPVTSLKVRASYGTTGNTSVDPYQTLDQLNRTVYSFGGAGAFGYAPNTIANPDLKWEKTATFDAGVDFGVLGQPHQRHARLLSREHDRPAHEPAIPYSLGYSEHHAEHRRHAQHRPRARALGDHARRLEGPAVDQRHHLVEEQERDRLARRRRDERSRQPLVHRQPDQRRRQQHLLRLHLQRHLADVGGRRGRRSTAAGRARSRSST